MKRFITVFMLICIFASMLVVSAYAEEPTRVGVLEVLKAEVSYKDLNNGTQPREGFRITFRSQYSDGSIAKDYTTVRIELFSGTTYLGVVKPQLGNKDNNNDSDFHSPDGKLLKMDTNNYYTPTANFVIWGTVSDSWSAEWATLPTDTLLPDSAVVYVDGESASLSFNTIGASNGKSTGDLVALTAPVAVRDGNGNRFYNSLEEAVAAANDGATIELRDKKTYTLPKTDKKLTIKAAGGASEADVTVKADFPVANMSNLNLNGVTVEAPAPVYVPATADNSQMGLWCVLFAALAVTAMLTRKKRSA